MKLCVCCCGTVLDLDTVPIYSQKLQRPGQWCPVCAHPLNDEALALVHHAAANPQDAHDSLRHQLREQLRADVLSIVSPPKSLRARLNPASAVLALDPAKEVPSVPTQKAPAAPRKRAVPKEKVTK